jgi:CheY-like chemotaxis protein
VDVDVGAGTVNRSATALGDRQRVLLVDDNPANRQLAQLILEQLGYEVDAASSGDRAIQMVASNRYAAVLMDCEMPGTDGWEATRRIRLSRSHAALPIIAFTTSTSRADRRRCAEAGMSGMVAKPATKATMSRTMHRWCQRASLSD